MPRWDPEGICSALFDTEPPAHVNLIEAFISFMPNSAPSLVRERPLPVTKNATCAIHLQSKFDVRLAALLCCVSLLETYESLVKASLSFIEATVGFILHV